MTQQIACIYNESSGTIAEKKEIQRAFKNYDVTIDFLPIKLGEQSLIEKLQNKSYTCVVAAGGDGTVRLTAQLAVRTNHTLGVLPLGTLNHFAKDAGLPLDLESAAQVISRGSVSLVDYCTANGQVFVNNASLGIYPATVKQRDKTPKLWGKWLAGTRALLGVLYRNKNLKCTVITPDGTRNYSTPLLFIGNNPYSVEKLGLGNREKLNTGAMFVYVVRTSKRRKVILLGILNLFGIHPRTAQANEVTEGPLVIQSTDKKTPVALDGEVFTMEFPLEFEMHKGKLTLLR